MAFSGQSRLAFQAGFNDALYGRPSNNPYNISVVGASHAAYEEGYENGLISDIPPRGPKGDQGEQGNTGSNGPPGINGGDGSDGQDGTSVLTGTGAPDNGDGNNGDVYIDGDNGDIYEKVAGVWNLIGSPAVAQTTRTDTDGMTPEKIKY